MEGLGERRLRQVIEVGARLAAAPDLPSLRLTTVETFSALLGADLTSYNEIAPGRPPLVIADSPSAPVPEETELLGSLIHQNPLVAHFAGTGDGSARRFSDFLSARELRRLELHRRLYSEIGVNFQAAISTASPDGAIVGVALSRAEIDFDDREVAALDLLRPHLFAAHRRLTEIEWLQRMLSALADESGPAVVLADPDGTILRASPSARELLGEEAEEQVPEPILAALEAGGDDPGAGATVLAFEHRGAVLRARVSAGALGEPSVVSLSRPRVEAMRLMAFGLGLSPREAELVSLLPGGPTSPELGAKLGISPRTVEKHLANAYRKLGVGGRTEAVARVLAPPG